ncbi:MAG TPA: hypothetical protein VGN88_04605, partial [Phycisphaerae bacterium]
MSNLENDPSSGNPYGMPPNSYTIYDPPPPSPYGNSPKLIQVTAILNLVMAGLDFLWGGVMVVVLIVIGAGGMSPEELSGDAGPGGATPKWLFILVAGIFALFCAIAGILKLTGGVKLLRRTRFAWGIGLSGGIVGCMQLWCSYFCVLPMGIGIFTIVVLALENSRRYLRENPRVDPNGPPPLPV